MMNHNRLYSAVLAIFAVYNAILVTCTLSLAYGIGWQKGPVGHVPAWAVPWLFTLICAYTIAIIVTLFARRHRPAVGCRLTRILNLALLPALPVGTVIGIYGLWKVDRGA
jgi:uncharacterized membrane protein